jgi:hypothetical protein
LPPVHPPSGKFILELFLVPGLIVGLIVCLLLLANWFLSSPQTPEAFLKRLDDPNIEVRWRAASDLAQVLPRNDKLAANPELALELAERLQQAVRDGMSDEQALAARLPKLTPAEAEVERLKLRPRRDFISYLTLSLGGFMIPVGVPVLRQIAEDDTRPDRMECLPHALRRRQAVTALTGLSLQLQRFDKLSGLDKTEASLQLETLGEKNEHADWVRQASEHLRRRAKGQGDALGVDVTLERCSRAEDPWLRELTALALSFWHGTAEENERMEATLERLLHDDGRGLDREADYFGVDPEGATYIEKNPGFLVRVNAALALARRGSRKAETALGLYRTCLDEKELDQILLTQEKNGPTHPSKGKIGKILSATLDALAQLHRQQPSLDLSSLRPSIDQLAGHGDAGIQKGAHDLQKALDGK